MLKDTWFIAKRDSIHLLRQRETILWVFVMPILFFYFIGTVTGGMALPDENNPTPLSVHYPGEDGFLLRELVLRLQEQNFEVVPDSETALVVETDNFTADVLAKIQTTLTLRTSAAGPQTQYDQVRAARAVYSIVADLAVLDEPSEAAIRALHRRTRTLSMSVVSAGARREVPTGFEQSVPGIMVMFTMLVLLTSGAMLLVIEREQGLLRRLASTPISRGSVVLGKWVARMALALVQVGFGLLVGTVLFRIDWGGAIATVGLVLLGWAGFNASLGLLLGTLARTQSQTAGLGLLTTMALAALGGCWWPIEITPAWMQSLALFLPSGWAMDAMHKLVSFDQSGTAAIPHIAALIVAALAAGWLAARNFRYA